MRGTFIAMAALLALSGAPAQANDSSAELATGGLVLKKNTAVELQSEDLFISAKEIRVRYRFYNGANKDVTTVVAFPMPDVTVEGPDNIISLPTENPKNLLDFTTVVDGKRVATEVEQKVYKDGVDHTAVLLSLGVPLAPHLVATNDVLDRLPRAAWDKLLRLRLAEIEEYDIGQGMQKHLSARWTLKTTYFWKQTFPAGAAVEVEHRYKPSVGATVQTAIGNRDAMTDEWFASYGVKYCMDADFIAAAQRAHAAAGGGFSAPFSEERISYVLKTGGNWAGPIRTFRLVVDKGSPQNLVSFCGEGVKKISATEFEMVKKNFEPQTDLHVLILKRIQSL